MPTVLIWDNHEVRPFGKKWAGHAAFNIVDTWPKRYAEDNQEHYVSWIPLRDKESHSGHSQGFAQGNFLWDLHYEGYAPDHIIRFSANVVQVNSMLRAWAASKEKNAKYMERNVVGKGKKKYMENKHGPSYRYYVKNCSNAVIKILKSAHFAKKSSVIIKNLSPIWTPLMVKRYADNIAGAKRLLWSDFVGELMAKGCVDRQEGEMLLKFQRRHESIGSSGASPRNFASGAQSDYTNVDKPGKLGTIFSFKGKRMTLGDIIRSIGDETRG